MATYGNVGDFKESEEWWTQYAERLEQHFAANEIKDTTERRAILLSVCGCKTYGLIRDLLQLKTCARRREFESNLKVKVIYETLENHLWQ